ncbi:uncharacterized protein ACBR49_019369 [Aulostomus maculatus]
MSLQVCHCGWSKVTTPHDLRVHQGKKGCTPKEARIPDRNLFVFGNPFPKFSFTEFHIRAETPLPDMDQLNMSDFPLELVLPGPRTQQLKEFWTQEGTQRPLQDMLKEPQEDCRAIVPYKNEPFLTTVSSGLSAQTPAAPAGATTPESSSKSQQRSDQIGAREDTILHAPNFFPSPQPVLTTVSSGLSAQTPAAPAGATAPESSSKSQQHSDQSDARVDEVSRAFDFSKSPQPVLTTVSSGLSAQTPAAPAGATNPDSSSKSQQRSDQSGAREDTILQAPNFFPSPQPVLTTVSSGLSAQTPAAPAGATNPDSSSKSQQRSDQSGAREDTILQAPNFFPSPQPFLTTVSSGLSAQTPAAPAGATTPESSSKSQQRSDQIGAREDTILQAPNFFPSPQPVLTTVSSGLSAQTPAAPSGATTPESFFKSPHRSDRLCPRVDKVIRAFNFSTGAEQVDELVCELPKTNILETEAKRKERERKESEAQKLLKLKQDRTKAILLQKIHLREQKAAEVNLSMETCKGELDAEMLDINDVFSEVLRVVEDAWRKALQPLKERRKEVKKEAQDLVTKLQKEVDELKKTFDDVDKNLDSQISSQTHLDDGDWKNATVDTSFAFGTLRTTTSAMMDQIQQKLENLTPLELMRIPTFAVDVKLDPNTAHRCLILSPDGKTVRDGGKTQKGLDTPERFDQFGSILAVNRFTSGKSYWEVEVSNKTGWDVGVTRGKANRKGKLLLRPNEGYWVIVHYEDKKFAALTDPPTSLSLQAKPQKVGVFVDYKGGLVTFYDVTNQSHIFSFTECLFDDVIIPYFSPHLKQNKKNSDPLIITAVSKQ